MSSTTNLFRTATDFELYVQGETIFHAGAAGSVMYVVQEGEVDILVNGHWVESIGEGGIFGEMVLVDSQPHYGSVVARTDCRVVPIDQRRFTDMVQETPQFALQVMSVMADRLRYMHEFYEINS